jgi:effector-binding domain-containing protein
MAVCILVGSVHTIKKNIEALVVASKENGLEILSTWTCLEIIIQDKATIQRLIIMPLKGWKSSNIWEQP